jgi:hypothetical protein
MKLLLDGHVFTSYHDELVPRLIWSLAGTSTSASSASI